jgi:hypothetical protein
MILTTIGFLFGVHLTMTFFGACYRIIDLAHELGQHLVSIASKIALNLTIILLIYVFAESDFLHGFFYGQVFFSLFHVGIFWLGQLLVTLVNMRSSNR